MDGKTLHRWSHPQLILVATNLADTPGLILEAMAQARGSGASILLVHVLPPLSLRVTFGPKPDSMITHSRVGAAWDVLHRATELIRWEGIRCEPVLVEGDPTTEIPKIAMVREADRILVATRSARGIGRLFEGSVAEALITSAPVPVCVVGPNVVPNPLADGDGGCIVLAASLYAGHEWYLDFGFRLTRERHADLILLHVLNGAGLNEEQRRDARAAARGELEEMVTRAGLDRYEILVFVREGAPANAILDEWICPDRDMIVMGGSSPGLIAKLRGNSVVHQVIARARCPVMTVRAPDSAGAGRVHAAIGKETHGMGRMRRGRGSAD